MKTNTNKGFTLIELIMVIVILGILAAVAVPKFFAISGEAHDKTKQAVVGNIKSGLQLFAAHKLVATGSKTYPAVNSAFLDSVLDEIPTGWTFIANATKDTIEYDADGTQYTYDGAGNIALVP